MLTRYLSIGLAIAFVAWLVNPLAGGVLASIVLGFMAGNFACSLVHRLPRQKSILEHKPYCGNCSHPLSELDLLPVFGALMLRHKCRYCHVAFPTTHTWTEALIGALFALCFIQYGFSQEYLLVGGIGVFLIILACIDINDRVVQTSVLVTAMILGMLYRTAMDGEIFGFLQGGLYGAVLGAIIWRNEIKPVNHIYSIPPGAKLLAMAGVIAGAADVWGVFLIFVVLNVVGQLSGKRVPLTVPLSIAIVATLLVPELQLHHHFGR
jgi:prepilin signal peptidase PulO-like enzyme (type II secretory pathway)